jgi:hypothetical protein
MWAEDIYIFRPFAFCGFDCLFQFSRSGRMIFVVTTSKFFWKVLVDLLEKDCVGFAKEAAYSFILSFFPMLIFVVALFALLGRDSKTEVLQTLQQILPSSSFLLISEYVNQLFQTQPAGLLSVSFVAMVLPATGLVATLAKALDRIYCVPQRRSFWSEQLTCIALVFIIGVPLFSATIAGIIGAYLERSAFSWLSASFVKFGTLERHISDGFLNYCRIVSDRSQSKDSLATHPSRSGFGDALVDDLNVRFWTLCCELWFLQQGLRRVGRWNRFVDLDVCNLTGFSCGRRIQSAI